MAGVTLLEIWQAWLAGLPAWYFWVVLGPACGIVIWGAYGDILWFKRGDTKHVVCFDRQGGAPGPDRETRH